ncbi:hypothetical protein Microterr_17890 [Microbacterium terricola]|uniref:glucan endo-1,3-beta-D-glucosidase n=2 Tax=Microbacterium terricola TaxID=344163 RepID=A0ABM8DZV3_9MICO|nr:hypothetical protein Microterr_17890 [Microbacterium terricola]
MLRLTAIAAAAVLLGGCTAAGTDADTDAGPSAAPLADVPMQRTATLDMSRLAEGVTPPTNRWYSGLAFGADPQPVYPYPLAFAASADGFAVDLPPVTASATTVSALFAGGLGVDLAATGFQVVRADPVSVTLRYSDGDGAIGDVTVAEGWPVVGFTAARDATLTPAAALTPSGDGVWAASADETSFGVTAPGAEWDGGGLHVAVGASAQWFAVPADSTLAAWTAALSAPVDAVAVSHSTTAETATTTLEYEGTSATVLVPFAGRDGADDCGLGSFPTAYGTASACAATGLEWDVPRLEARDAYDLARLDESERARLATQIDADLAATGPLPVDTYYGGKALARLGDLLSLARSIGADALADEVADRLDEELAPWIQADGCATRTAQCVTYDDALHLVVGREPSFGSEEGNDHHFHYGHFLLAAAALAEHRPSAAAALAPVIDLLAADIATGADDPDLPALRVFDPYRGHSWASGPAPFADGNNQESSSEAVAAWNGLALWAQVRSDDALAATAEWMLSAEAEAARTLWLEPKDLADGYEHGIVSLSWGGKRDYATWFSAEPSAILGIQLLPMGPLAQEYLAGDPDRIARNVAEAGGAASFRGPLGDYVLMYSALAGADALAVAQAALADLPDDAIDDGNSRSAMQAWVAAVHLGG